LDNRHKTNNAMTVVEIIQSMMAPAVMISACGLLILGMNNKYSMVINRIRALDEEKRKLKQMAEENSLNAHQEKRFNSIDRQTGKLAFRIKMVKNAVVCYSTAVALFIITCLGIGLNIVFNNFDISGLVVVFFLLGMLSVFLGIIYAVKEVMKGYEIIYIEIEES